MNDAEWWFADDYEPADDKWIGQWSAASARKLKIETNGENEMAETKEGRLTTPVFRASFPQVFQAKAVVAGQEPKFSIAMLFPKVFTEEYCAQFKVTPASQLALLNNLKAAVNNAAVGKWGPDKAKWPKGLKSPWHDGTEKDYDGYDASVIYCSASSKIKPGVVDAKMQPIIEQNDFYGGCYAHATLTVFAYDNVTKGVGFGLRNIQKVRDGEPFGGGSSKVEDDFAPIEAPASTPVLATASAASSDPLGI